MSDPIADMLAQISNANHKMKESADMPSSNIKVEIAKVLKEEGFISNYRTTQDHKQGRLRLALKYSPQKERVIKGVKRISRSSLRIYKKWNEIPLVRNGLGIAIISTSKGVMVGAKAREKKIGGEILCTVW